MASLDWIAPVVAPLSLAYWAAVAHSAWRTAAEVHAVEDLPLPKLPSWSRLSRIVPARDEGGTLAVALTARLADPYPALEVIVVDDRSTDATAAIADEFAHRDPCARGREQRQQRRTLGRDRQRRQQHRRHRAKTEEHRHLLRRAGVLRQRRVEMRGSSRAARASASTVRAGVLGARQGGLRWRSTFYPAAQLLAGRRLMGPGA